MEFLVIAIRLPLLRLECTGVDLKKEAQHDWKSHGCNTGRTIVLAKVQERERERERGFRTSEAIGLM